VEEALKAIEYPNVQTVQIIFNMFRHRPAELFFTQARERQIGILARVPLASGMLTGKMRAGTAFEENDHRNFNRYGQAFDVGETFSGVPYDASLAAVEELRELVPEGVTMAQLALRWILMFDAVTCAIPGAKTPAQAADNVAASDLPPLDEGSMKAVRDVYDRLIRPHVHRFKRRVFHIHSRSCNCLAVPPHLRHTRAQGRTGSQPRHWSAGGWLLPRS